MSTPEERAEDYRLEAAAERRERTLAGRIEAGGCPGCGADEYTVHEAWSASQVDPEGWLGRCSACGYED